MGRNIVNVKMIVNKPPKVGLSMIIDDYEVSDLDNR